jgi:isocitrate dehydrogenase kinase/phosphatase
MLRKVVANMADIKILLADEIARLYKEKHGADLYHAALWGASQVFLSEDQLLTILDYAKQTDIKENN